MTTASAVVRAACAADAPLIARIGHGGVLRVIDYLPGDGIDWYGVAENENADLLGWTQAAAWSPARVDDAAPTLALVVSAAEQRLRVQDGDRILLTAPISTGRDLVPGIYTVTDRQPNGTDEQHVGAPWSLAFGDDLNLSGVYWHNRFSAIAPGAAVQVDAAAGEMALPTRGESHHFLRKLGYAERQVIVFWVIRHGKSLIPLTVARAENQ
ncbi:MAG: L,D-transpeptidase [Anaerolineae bacterium]